MPGRIRDTTVGAAGPPRTTTTTTMMTPPTAAQAGQWLGCPRGLGQPRTRGLPGGSCWRRRHVEIEATVEKSNLPASRHRGAALVGEVGAPARPRNDRWTGVGMASAVCARAVSKWQKPGGPRSLGPAADVEFTSCCRPITAGCVRRARPATPGGGKATNQLRSAPMMEHGQPRAG
jgi:hypothetical protein